MMELLAPAGSMEALDACVSAGADAVYLGLTALNARRGAANFTPEELSLAAFKLHQRGMKLYVTVNTLVGDGEFDSLKYVADAMAQAGADAAIVQDIGVAAYLKSAVPSLKLHASTQMAINNRQGVRWLKDMGFSRAILARETTLDEISRCAKEGLPLEAFGHGAMCVSLSGLCLMSSMVGGRSGNRGLCAQPCRLKYTLGDVSGDLISPKDLMTIGFLRSIEDAGVKSLKLEGRLKSPDYVYAVVSAYRRALDGEVPDEASLRRVFNRGYTKGYFTGVEDMEFMSDPTVGHVEAGEISFEPREKKVKLDVKARIAFGESSVLTVSDGEDTVEVNGLKAEKAEKAALDEQAVSRALLKTGGTPYIIDTLKCDIAPGSFMRVKDLNDLRRKGLEAISAARVERRRGCSREVNSVVLPETAKQENSKPLISVQSSDASHLKIARELGTDETVYAPMDITRLPDEIDADAVVIPPSLNSKELDEINEWAQRLRFKACVLSNPSQLSLKWPGEARLDWPMNVFNSLAVKTLGLPYAPSVELTTSAIAALPGRKELIVYGRLTLMRLRTCPLRAARRKGPHINCDECKNALFVKHRLIDRKNVSFPLMRLKTREGCVVQVLNSVPLMLLRKLDKLCGAYRWRIILTDEDEYAVRAVITSHISARDGKAIEYYDFMDKMKTTTGHYFRGVE